jgi:hypothetical protein
VRGLGGALLIKSYDYPFVVCPGIDLEHQHVLLHVLVRLTDGVALRALSWNPYQSSSQHSVRRGVSKGVEDDLRAGHP